jgi:hypothetical protein
MSTETTNLPAREPQLPKPHTPITLVNPLSQRAMQPEPVGMSVAAVAARLDKGETVSVQLQPGDGTRYDLLLVPVWAEHVGAWSLGFTENGKRQTLFVINAQSPSKLRGTYVMRGGYYGVLLECGAWYAPWSVTLLEWWLEEHVWPRLAAIRGAGR